MSHSFEIIPQFLDCDGRRLFALLYEPVGQPPKATILFLFPFAEEMHKSRRTVAQQARRLAVEGYAMLLLDLSGCGDSGGDFEDASWQAWRSDSQCAMSWLQQRYAAPLVLSGLRLGALLACDLTRDERNVSQLLMWQPALNGEQHIDQFLRLELAGQALKGHAGFDRAGLWSELRSGQALGVAGYRLSSVLALEISAVRLGDLRPGCPVAWIEIGNPPSSQPRPACARVINNWQQAGVDISWQAVPGEAFWRNVDAPDSPALIDATVAALL